MHRISVLIVLTLMLTAILWAQTEPSPLYFKLLEADRYELDMFYSSELQRLFVQVDFDLNKAALEPAFHYGVFLSKDAVFQNVTVCGKFAGHYFVNNLVPQHFVPENTKTELFSPDCPARFYGLYLNNFTDLPEEVHYRLWYYLPVPGFKLDDMNKLSTTLDPSLYWYPRNTSRSCTVELKLTTTPYMTLLVGNSFAPQIDKQYSRTHKSIFLERPDQPASFCLIRD